MLLLGLLFFLSFRDSRDLPSFPTRRSSDLRVGAIIEEPRFHPHLTGRENLKVHAAAREVRSEEHTSELQSLRQLVCRLLLEKKKTKRKSLQTTQRNGGWW